MIPPLYFWVQLIDWSKPSLLDWVASPSYPPPSGKWCNRQCRVSFCFSSRSTVLTSDIAEARSCSSLTDTSTPGNASTSLARSAGGAASSVATQPSPPPRREKCCDWADQATPTSLTRNRHQATSLRINQGKTLKQMNTDRETTMTGKIQRRMFGTTLALALPWKQNQIRNSLILKTRKVKMRLVESKEMNNTVQKLLKVNVALIFLLIENAITFRYIIRGPLSGMPLCVTFRHAIRGSLSGMPLCGTFRHAIMRHFQACHQRITFRHAIMRHFQACHYASK